MLYLHTSSRLRCTFYNTYTVKKKKKRMQDKGKITHRKQKYQQNQTKTKIHPTSPSIYHQILFKFLKCAKISSKTSIHSVRFIHSVNMI